MKFNPSINLNPRITFWAAVIATWLIGFGAVAVDASGGPVAGLALLIIAALVLLDVLAYSDSVGQLPLWAVRSGGRMLWLRVMLVLLVGIGPPLLLDKALN